MRAALESSRRAAALQASTRLPSADTRTGSTGRRGRHAAPRPPNSPVKTAWPKLGEFPEPRRAEHDTHSPLCANRTRSCPVRACTVQPRKRCPLFRSRSAISCHPGSALGPKLPRASLSAQGRTQRGCWSLPTKVGPSLSRPATGREYKELNTAHRGLLRSTSIPYPNFFVPSPVRFCSPWLLSPTSSMLPPNSSSPSSRRTSPSCKRPSSETCSRLTLLCPRACTDAVFGSD